MDISFPKSERLCKAKDFEHVFSNGKSLYVFPLKVQFSFIQTDTPTIKVAFFISAKKIKKAVHRNYLKRVLREIYRKNKYILHNEMGNESLFLVFVYLSDEKLSYHQIEPSVLILLKQLHEVYKKHSG